MVEGDCGGACSFTAAAIARVEEQLKGIGRTLDRDRQEHRERDARTEGELRDLGSRITSIEATRNRFGGALWLATALAGALGSLFTHLFGKGGQ